MAGKAGQIVHAVIVPKGTDPAILKEIYGDNWPDEMPDAMSGDTGTSVTYVLNQKSEFLTLSQPKDFTMKDGKTKIQVVTGDLKPGKTKSDGILDLPDPTGAIAEQANVVTDADTIACAVDDELWKLGRLVWTSLAMAGATPEQRLSMVTTGVSVFQAFMTDLLNQLGQQAVDGSAATKSDMGKYGVGDMFHRVLGEIRGLKKAVTDNETKNDKDKMSNAQTASNPSGKTAAIGTKEDNDMGEITREEFDGFKATVEGFSKKFDEFVEKAGKADATDSVATVDASAAKTDEPNLADIKTMIAELSTKFDAKVAELDTKVTDTAAKTDALQRSGKSANVVEDPTRVNGGKKSDCKWAELPQFAGR